MKSLLDQNMTYVFLMWMPYKDGFTLAKEIREKKMIKYQLYF